MSLGSTYPGRVSGLLPQSANNGSSGAPAGAAGGDLGGTYPNPTVPALALPRTVITRAVAASGAIATTDEYLLVNTNAARSLSLPNPATKRCYTIKDVTGLAETNPITITRFAAETLEGLAASRVLQANFGVWNIVSDGTNWWLV